MKTKKKVNKKKKRVWCLLGEPGDYAIQCDKCGGKNIIWSEWDKMIWCRDCKKDTRGTRNDCGLMGVMASRILGCPMDMINLKTGMLKIPESKKPLTHEEYRAFVTKKMDKAIRDSQ